MTETPASTPEANSPRESGRGGLVLTLGILSLVICALLGPFAWMMGKGDLEKMASGRMDDRDQGITKAGMICGIIGTVILCLGILFGLITVVGGGAASTF